MKPLIIITPYLPYSGITLFPFILLRKKDAPFGEVLLNHERIHLRQQLELLILPFYIWYLCSYLFYRFKGLSHHTAYRSILFEREAYAHEKDLDYLRKRRFWAFLRS